MRLASCLLIVLTTVGLSGCAHNGKFRSSFSARAVSPGMFRLGNSAAGSCDCRRLGRRAGCRNCETACSCALILDPASEGMGPAVPDESQMESPDLPETGAPDAAADAPDSADSATNASCRNQFADEIAEVIDVSSPAFNSGDQSPARMLAQEFRDFELQDDLLVTDQTPPIEIEWNSQLQSEQSVLEDTWAGEPEPEMETSPENQTDPQPSLMSANDRVEFFRASTSRTLLDAELPRDFPSPPLGITANSTNSNSTDQPLSGRPENSPAPIVLQARPVERHVVNDHRTGSKRGSLRHSLFADPGLFTPTQLRPTETIQIQDLPKLDRTLPAPAFDFPIEEPVGATLEKELPVPFNAKPPNDPQNDPLTKTTSYQVPVDQSVVRESPNKDIVLQARPEADALTNYFDHNQATISKRPQRNAILRLTATTVPDENAQRPSIASFDLHPPKIVRVDSPEVIRQKPETDSENSQHATLPVSKAQTLLPSATQTQPTTQLQAKTQLKTIER